MTINRIFSAIAPLVSLALVVAYSAIATISKGTLAAEAVPLLIIAIGLAVWHDRVTAA